jgi:hypothetical protein
MLKPLPRWATGCTYPLLPLPHRPSPKSHGSASHNAPFNDFRTAGCFRGCSHSIIFRPPSLLATQVVPTVEHRFRCPRQPWRLHLSRTCVVAFACIRYANRPNRAIDGKRLSLSRFAALPAAPGLTPSRLRLADICGVTGTGDRLGSRVRLAMHIPFAKPLHTGSFTGRVTLPTFRSG